MNKEKEKLIIDAIRDKAYRVNRTARPVYGQGQYDMAYEILGDVEMIIQSEPGEKTNFDVITESPEKLAEFIMEIQDDTRKGEEWPTAEYCRLYCLNQKAGE